MKAIIVDTGNDHVDDVRRELLDWAEGLGVDVRNVSSTFLLLQIEQKWRAVFSIRRKRDGHDYVVPGTNRLATDYGSYAVDVESWPSWFPPPSEVPLMTAANMLELLDIAAEAEGSLRSGAAWRRKQDAVAGSNR